MNETPLRAATLEDFRVCEASLFVALMRPGWAILTATRLSYSAGENRKRNIMLGRILTAMSFPHEVISGYYKGQDEGQSYLITNITGAQALLIGRYFGQESVLIPAGLLYHDATLSPVRLRDTAIGDKALKKDFYSQLVDGPAFSVGINHSKRIPVDKALELGIF